MYSEVCVIWLCIANQFHLAREVDRVNFWSYVRHLKAFDLMTIHASILWDDYPPFKSFLYFLYEKCIFDKLSKWGTKDFLRKLSSYHYDNINPGRKRTFMIQDIDKIFVVRGDDPTEGLHEVIDNFLRTRFNVVYNDDFILGLGEKNEKGQLALTAG